MWTKDLDPFGDGSLVKSWTFDDKLTNEQNNGTFVCSHPAQLLYTNVKFDHGARLKQERDIFPELVSDCNHSVASLGPASFTVWLRSPVAGTNNRTTTPLSVAMGGVGQRYNFSVDVIFLNQSGDTWRKSYVEVGVHKLGDSTGIIPFAGEGASRLAMFTWSYDPTTEETKIYMNTDLIHIATTQMKWISNPFEIVTREDHMVSTLYSYVDQMMEWNRPLTHIEVIEIYNMTAIPPETDTSDATANTTVNATALAHIIYPPQATANITINTTAEAFTIYKAQATANIIINATALANINYFPLAYINTTVNATALANIILNPYAVAIVEVITEVKNITSASATHTDIVVNTTAKANVLGVINIAIATNTLADLWFNSDGSKLFATERSTFEYNLGLNWSLEGGATYVRQGALNVYNPAGGSIITSNGIYSFALSAYPPAKVVANKYQPGWKINTPTLQTEMILDDNWPGGIFFKPDGLKLFIISRNTLIRQYTLSEAFNLDTATFTSSKALAGNWTGLFFKPDGAVMYTAEMDGYFKQWSLSEAWNIDTLVNTGIKIESQKKDDQVSTCVYFSPDGYILFSAQKNVAFQYFLQIPWDLSTASNEWRFYDPKAKGIIKVDILANAHAYYPLALITTEVVATANAFVITAPISLAITEVITTANAFIVVIPISSASTIVGATASAFVITAPISLAITEVITTANAFIVAAPIALSIIEVNALVSTIDLDDLNARLDLLFQCCGELSASLSVIEENVKPEDLIKAEDIKYLFSGREVIFDV